MNSGKWFHSLGSSCVGRIMIIICVSGFFLMFIGTNHIQRTTTYFRKPIFNNQTFSNQPEYVKFGNQASSIEKTPWTRYFIPLRNVCLTASNIHFFNSPNDTKQFYKDSIPYSNWIKNNKVYLEEKYHFFVLSHQFSMNSWASNKTVRYFNKTVFLASPHHPDNQFHLNNDIIFPLLFDVIRSNSKNEDKMVLFFRGWEERVSKHLLMYHVVERLFNNHIIYPFEELFNDFDGLCFRRFIWGQARNLQPFYTHSGRYGLDNAWKGIIPEIRDWINDIFNISTAARSPSDLKPHLTWISRSGINARTVVREKDLIRILKKKFAITILPFFDSHNDSLLIQKHIVTTLSILRDTDILAGVHGAGLGHAVHLQSGSILLELKTNLGYKNLFMNICNLQGIGYYAMDVRPFQEPFGIVMYDDTIRQLSKELMKNWKDEIIFAKQDAEYDGQCRFLVQRSDKYYFMSKFVNSRCFLENCTTSGDWKQCSHSGECDCFIGN